MKYVKPDKPDAQSGAENSDIAPEAARGPRARMRKMLLTTAMEMMARGITPSIAELAEAADVSRATAYRYFATQGELVSAVVGESLGPVLDWQSDAPTAAERVDALFCATYPRLEEYEVPLRAAIQLSLQQLAQQRAGLPASERPFARGYRIQRLRSAAQPLDGRLDEAQFDRVVQALSLLYGTEVFLVLKDIWRLELDQILDVVRWTAGAILQRAEREVPVAASRPKSRATPLRKAAGIGVAAKKVEKLAKEAAARAAVDAAAKMGVEAGATPTAKTAMRPAKTSAKQPAFAQRVAQKGAAQARRSISPVDKPAADGAATLMPVVPRAARPPTQTSRRKPRR